MKKHLIYFLLLLPALFMASGCQKYEVGSPLASTVADFTYTASNSGKAPCEVTFTDKSLNAAGYLWDFGNGQTSTEANPVAAYSTPGLYTVKLTCTPVNDVYYNQLIKTQVINVKDPNAGLTQVLYFTTRGTNGGVHFVLLDDPAHNVSDFASVVLPRPYGITVDTAHSKVYVADYSINTIYRFDADGTNPVTILDGAVAGQEICQSPEGLMVVGDKLYWGSPGGIFRSNLDGTSPEVYNSNLQFPIDMQYDPTTNMVYLINEYSLPEHTGGYFTLNFDGTGLTQPLADIDGTAIEVNTETGKVYIAGYGDAGPTMPENGIYMCNLDGTQLSKIGDYGAKATWGIAIDNKRGKLFWSFKNSNSAADGKIIRANLDGSGQEDWITGVNPNAMQAAWIKL
ncbi:MAG: PKD domain-containing protein [Bacteroidota bacterium]